MFIDILQACVRKPGTERNSIFFFVELLKTLKLVLKEGTKWIQSERGMASEETQSRRVKVYSRFLGM